MTALHPVFRSHRQLTRTVPDQQHNAAHRPRNCYRPIPSQEDNSRHCLQKDGLHPGTKPSKREGASERHYSWHVPAPTVPGPGFHASPPCHCPFLSALLTICGESPLLPPCACQSLTAKPLTPHPSWKRSPSKRHDDVQSWPANKRLPPGGPGP